MSNNCELRTRFSHLFAKADLFVLSGPSGSGKSTVVKALLERMPELGRSVSVTTRAPRRGEKNGRDYVFVSRAEFEGMIKDGLFLEHAEVYGNLYGTSRKFIEDMLADGRNVLLDIDICGVKQLRHSGLGATYVYILPPSTAALSERLNARGTDSAKEITGRLAKFEDEIADIKLYDYVVFNTELEETVTAVQTIIRAQRHRIER